MGELEARNIKGADVGQMFTPPKSKSPWEAMTTGSTGGWAAPFNAWGPVITAASGAIPGVGPLIATGLGAAGAAGKGSGFQGTDRGWGNLAPTLMGGLGGYSLGSLGAGVGTGLEAMMSPTATIGKGTGSMSFLNAAGTGPAKGLNAFASGFGQGAKNYAAPLTNAFGNLLGMTPTGAVGKATTFAWPNAAGASNIAPVATALTKTAEGAAAGAGGGGAQAGTSLLDFGGAMSLGSALMQMGQQRGGFEGELFSNQNFLNTPEVQAYANSIGQAKTQLGQMGRDELKRVLESPIGSIVPDDNAYMQAMMRRTEEAAKQRKETITSNYNSIGRANSSEHVAELNKIDLQTEQAKQDLAAVIANEKIKLEMDYRLTALSGALGVDQQAAAELAGLTNLSVQEAALKYGLQEQEVAELRKMAMLQQLVQQMGYRAGKPVPSGDVWSMLRTFGIG